MKSSSIQLFAIDVDGTLLDSTHRLRMDVSTATFSKTNYLEVLPVGVNKAKALALLTAALGFELSRVAAIGDAPNDLEMLKEVGLAIAMGNASSEIKVFAKWVVGTNDEAGVAQAAQRLLDGVR